MAKQKTDKKGSVRASHSLLNSVGVPRGTISKKEYNRLYSAKKRFEKSVYKDIEKGNDKRFAFIFKKLPTVKQAILVNGKEQMRDIPVPKTKKRLEMESAVFGYFSKKYQMSKEQVMGTKFFLVKNGKLKNKTWIDTLESELKEVSEFRKLPRYETVYFEDFGYFLDEKQFINFNGEILDKKHFLLEIRKITSKFPNGFLFFNLLFEIHKDENDLFYYKVSFDVNAVILKSKENGFYRETGDFLGQKVVRLFVVFTSDSNEKKMKDALSMANYQQQMKFYI